MHYTLYDVSLFLLQAMEMPMRRCVLALARVIGSSTPVMHDHGNIAFKLRNVILAFKLRNAFFVQKMSSRKIHCIHVRGSFSK